MVLPADATGPVPTAPSQGNGTVEPPTIGVASIPVADQDRPPATVPSLAVAESAPAGMTLTGSVPVGTAQTAPVETAPVETAPVERAATGSAPTATADIARSSGTASDPTARALAPVPDPAGDEVPVPPSAAVDPGDHRFAPGVAAKMGNYVYLLVDPRTGRPFFAGRGKGDRCFRHVQEAGRTDRAPKFAALDRIREIESSGRAVRVDILRYGLSADEALLVEAATRDALGLPGQPKLGSQRLPADEVDVLLAKRAKFKRSHQVVLLRVGPTGADADYEQIRHGWRIGRRWTDLASPRSPGWAVVVVGDMVDDVYRIDRWEPTGSAPSPVGGAARYSFVGTPDPELRRRYVGRSVAPHLGAGTQSPVTYVWCGPHWVNTAR